MKKHILLSAILMLPIITFGMSDSSEMMCAQAIQPAINAQGECKEFPTSCDVPEDWKKVSSCSDFAEKKSITIGESTNRRLSSRWKALREKAAANTEEKSSFGNKKPSLFRQSRIYTKRNNSAESASDNKLSRKASTLKKWGSSFRKLVSPARQKVIDEKEKLQSIKDDAKSANKLRKRVGSSTEVKRNGKLSSAFWSTAQKAREKRSDRFSTSSETMKKALRSRQPFRKVKAKREHTPRSAKLRKIYRHTSQGSLDNLTNSK